MAFDFSSLKLKLKAALSYLSFRGQSTAIVLVQFFAIFIIGLVVVIFMKNTVMKNVSLIVEANKKIASFQERVSALNQLKQGYREVEKHTEKLYQLLVVENDIGDIITKLDKLFDHYALKGSIKIGEKTESGAIPVTVVTSSGLDTLSRYLLALEEQPYLVKVRSLEFKGPLNAVPEVILGLDIYLL